MAKQCIVWSAIIAIAAASAVAVAVIAILMRRPLQVELGPASWNLVEPSSLACFAGSMAILAAVLVRALLRTPRLGFATLSILFALAGSFLLAKTASAPAKDGTIDLSWAVAFALAYVTFRAFRSCDQPVRAVPGKQ